MSALSDRLEQGLLPEEVEWKPGKKEYAVMITLAIISLMVALDATILVSVLPVSTGHQAPFPNLSSDLSPLP